MSHLVENVLAYARLETRARTKPRGDRPSERPARSRQRTASSSRAEQAGHGPRGRSPDEAAGIACVHADPSAVEQILFNLVDNACKYAAAATDRRIHLCRRGAMGRVVVLNVRDHGPGVPRRRGRASVPAVLQVRAGCRPLRARRRARSRPQPAPGPRNGRRTGPR